MKINTISAILIGLSLMSSYTASAALLSTSFVKSTTLSNAHTGVAIDESTGKYYERQNYYTGGIIVYNSELDFINNNPLRTINTSTVGTYFEVINDVIYSRTNGGTTVSTFDINTGQVLLTNSMGPNIGNSGFNWGGYSSVNVMGDDNGLYAFSRSDATGTFWFQEFDENLNTLSSYNTGLGQLGFATIVNGNAFLGNSFNVSSFEHKFDLTTGVLSSVNHSFLLGNNGNSYITNMNYDSVSDTVYVSDINSNSIYGIENASLQLDSPRLSVESVDVPEPSTLAIFGFTLLGLGLRKRYKA